MIIDTLDNLGKYQGINPLFADVVEFLKKNDLNVMEDGKYPIKGKDLFLNLTTAQGKAPDEAEVETHVKMIDIQMPLDGPETYGYTPLCNLPEEEYNAEKDVTMYPGLMAESFIDLCSCPRVLWKTEFVNNKVDIWLNLFLSKVLKEQLVFS